MCLNANKPWDKKRTQVIKDTLRIVIEGVKEMDVDRLLVSEGLLHR